MCLIKAIDTLSVCFMTSCRDGYTELHTSPSDCVTLSSMSRSPIKQNQLTLTENTYSLTSLTLGTCLLWLATCSTFLNLTNDFFSSISQDYSPVLGGSGGVREQSCGRQKHVLPTVLCACREISGRAD